VLATLLHTRTEVRRLSPGGSVSATAVADGGGQGTAAHVGYASDVIEPAEQYLYRPLLRPLLRLGRVATRLQSGRLDAYLAYMLIALVAVLAVVIALT